MVYDTREVVSNFRLNAVGLSLPGTQNLAFLGLFFTATKVRGSAWRSEFGWWSLLKGRDGNYNFVS